MTLLRSWGSIALVLLGCLILEQLIHCCLVPAYLNYLVASPVFWGSFSALCFIGLKYLDYLDIKEGKTKPTDTNNDVVVPLPMMENIDDLVNDDHYSCESDFRFYRDFETLKSPSSVYFSSIIS